VRGPAGDIEDFDFDAAREKAPDQVGEYRIEGDTMTVAWGDGEVAEAEVEAGTDGCFHWNAGLFCPAEPFAASALSGTYEGGASGNSALGFALASRSYTFTPDGRYTLDAAASVSSTSSESTVSAGSTGSEAGSYTVDGTALTLTPDGGEPMMVAAFPFGEDVATDHPEWIYLGGTMMKRR